MITVEFKNVFRGNVQWFTIPCKDLVDALDIFNMHTKIDTVKEVSVKNDGKIALSHIKHW